MQSPALFHPKNFIHSIVRKRATSLVLSGLLILSPAFLSADLRAQDPAGGMNATWLILQTVPSLTWTGLPTCTHFAFEWEAAPVVYSFGMNPLDPPLHFFSVTQPERFAGSVELVVSAQLYTTSVGTSRWGFSGQILSHVPLIQKGEYLGFNLGAARYRIAGIPYNFVSGGVSTLFGFLHYNVKYSPPDRIWMHSIEFRFF